MNPDDELSEFLAGPLHEPGWVPRDDHDASRQMMRLHRLQRELDRIHAVARLRIADIELWRQEEERKLTAQYERVEAFLIAYYRNLENGDKKFPATYKLPEGEIKRRTPGRGRVEFVDEQALVEWAQANRPELLNPPKASKTAVAADKALHPVVVNGAAAGKLVTDAGEVVPGVQFVPPTERVSVSLAAIDPFDMTADPLEAA